MSNQDDATLKAYLDGYFSREKGAYNTKLKNVFGVTWSTVEEFLSQEFSKDEATGLIVLAPILVKSITSKDGGESDILLRKLSTFACMSGYNIEGRMGATNSVNKSLMRLVSLTIIHSVEDGAIQEGSKLGKAYKVASDMVSVINIEGSTSNDETKKIALEAREKIGKLSSKKKERFKVLVANLFSLSSFKKPKPTTAK
jgi:hypothetical protein